MKTLVSLIAVLLFTTATTFAQQATDLAQDPTALGNAFFKALLDENGDAVSKLITSDFSLVSFDGNAVAGDLLAQGMNGGYIVVETAALSNAQTRQYNNDAAVMTGTWKAKGSVRGQAFDSTVSFSVVSVKQGSSWKIANIQFTPIQ
ncbi:nuclear transport factor 2 family protein [Spirosoma agri]|uniref:Nuclear transport factor 2 family protein n=1 Tax=Spirosoma agri TaxID=1987381 RepID=A0A6M0IC29_9BACT|nr:nuclear transport factor 2 family protein [Spirosoma agri]NEU65648.1 nuclear transport factor 2 family protein [Spirosoma agri]